MTGSFAVVVNHGVNENGAFSAILHTGENQYILTYTDKILFLILKLRNSDLIHVLL